MKCLVFLSLVLLSCLAHAFEDPPLSVSAGQYRQLIKETRARGSGNPANLEKAKRYAEQNLLDDAIAEYEAAIAASADNTAVWIDLSRVWAAQDDDDQQQRTLQSTYNAYRVATAPQEKARALFLLGKLYEEGKNPKLAMAAYQEGLGLEENPKIAERYRKLVEANAFRVKGVEVDSNSASPRICLEFSGKLAKARQIHYDDYLLIEPAVKAVVSAREQKLCIEGVSFGQSYEITVRPGVPSAAGEKTLNAETLTTKVENRQPSLGFRGTTYILPKAGSQALPLSSVNVAAARLKLLRINDRNLTGQINQRRLSTALRGYDIREIADRSGELLWQGTLDLGGELNQETTTAIPIADILKDTQPGIYVITAESADKTEAENYEDRATQWLVVSDLGLTTFRGEDGLQVFVRSLDSALPLAGVELHLYARNNGDLGKAVSDESGRARFDPGLLRGSGGREPAVLMAYGRAGDFNFLDLTRPAFDLSDRGVAGREAPGPVDAFLYTERGVYRPGETVELMALLRSNQGYALDKLPLTLKLIRPDEVEANRLVVKTVSLGGYHIALPLANNARTGTWTVRAYTDPEAKPVGQLRFQVEDFVPQRLKLELATQAQSLQPDETVKVEVKGRFLYGAPAADLKTEAELVLQEDPDPYPAFPGYQFGLAQDSWTAKTYPVTLAGTDAQGRAEASIRLAERPETSRPLQALLRVSLFEPGGRPVNRSLSLPYRTQAFAIGIRPQFQDGGVAIGQEAGFEIIAVDPGGQRLPSGGLRAELFREEYQYYWYYQDNRWNYKLIVSDGATVQARDIGINPERPTLLRQSVLDWGNYRLEVYDAKTGVASSVRFRVGWFANPAGDADTPDQLRVTLDKARYRPGEKAQVHLKAAFAGEVLLTVASEKLWTARSVSLPADGTTVELPVAAEWGPGIYITATAFRPAASGSQRGPGRAVGLTWLELDPAPRTLNVALSLPAELKPRQTFALPVTVTGAEPGKPAYLTVAAVDEGILQLTDFASPDPVAYFLGKRKLGMDIRDIYGKLIEAGGRPGQLRSGGDTSSRAFNTSNLKTVKTVALFSGPVLLDAAGRASIPLELPDFNGQLRLMAVAWDASRLGRAEAPLLVRDPLVVEAYLPRFLAPQDRSRLTLTLQNLSAAAGDYRVQVTAQGAVALDDSAPFSFPVEDSGSQDSASRAYTLRALGPGAGQVDLAVSGPAGFELRRQWQISVRPAQAPVTETEAQYLPPGQSLTVNGDWLRGYLAGTGQIDLGFSSRPPLNVPALLEQLDRFPYGCVEQTTSRALPLLYFNQLAETWASRQETALSGRVQQAIAHLLNMQQASGGFGLWSVDNTAELWLSAYALDFLGRAKQQGYLVPEIPYRLGLDWLKQSLSETDLDSAALMGRSYALYVLARADLAPIGELRYLHDNYLNRLPTVLSRAQLGAALARYGDGIRAKEAFTAAFQLDTPALDRRDYGSPLRDQAALLVLLAETGMLTDKIPPLAQELAIDLNRHRYTSTQEKSWLLLAAHALSEKLPQDLRLAVDGKTLPPQSKPLYLKPSSAELLKGVTVLNQGTERVWTTSAVSGVPIQPQPPTQEGFSISRRYYSRTGQEIDPARIRQNDLLVAVISGAASSHEMHQALVVDLLPAGLEIENARLAHNTSTEQFQWLPQLSETLHSEFRDDRFVAALDLDKEHRQFTLAYLVRAVTPGDYRLPAVYIEDMYKPWYRGRGGIEQLKVEQETVQK